MIQQTPPPPSSPRRTESPPADPRKAQPAADQVPPRDVPLITIGKDEPRTGLGPVTPATGIGDVLLGAVGLVGAMLLASLILGAILGGLLVFFKHRLGFGGPDRDASDHVTLTER